MSRRYPAWWLRQDDTENLESGNSCQELEGQDDDDDDDNDNDDDFVSSSAFGDSPSPAHTSKSMLKPLSPREVLEREIRRSCKSLVGSFACSETYEDTVPNPGLTIAGFGGVGLPLSDVTAQQLRVGGRAYSGEQSLSHGGDINPPNATNTREFPGEDISLCNPKFVTWLQEVIIKKQVHQQLGIADRTLPQIKIKTRKLLISWKDGTFTHLPRESSQSHPPSAFASVAIILPSKYTGGTMIFQHDKGSKEMDHAINSQFSITVAAWYSDVLHTISPVISGYRLVLLIDLLLDSSPPPRPPFAPSTDLVNAVAKLDKVAFVIKYNLFNMITRDDYSVQKLIGSDRYLVDHLSAVARQLQYNMYLAKLKATGEDCEPYDSDASNDSWSALSKSLSGFRLVQGLFGDISDFVSWDTADTLPTGSRWFHHNKVWEKREEEEDRYHDTYYRDYYGVAVVLCKPHIALAMFDRKINPNNALTEIACATKVASTESQKALLLQAAIAAIRLPHCQLEKAVEIACAAFSKNSQMIQDALTTAQPEEITIEKLTEVMKKAGEKPVKKGLKKWLERTMPLDVMPLTTLSVIRVMYAALPSMKEVLLDRITVILSTKSGEIFNVGRLLPRHQNYQETYTSKEKREVESALKGRVNQFLEIVGAFGIENLGVFLTALFSCKYIQGNQQAPRWWFLDILFASLRERYPTHADNISSYEILRIDEWLNPFELGKLQITILSDFPTNTCSQLDWLIEIIFRHPQPQVQFDLLNKILRFFLGLKALTKSNSLSTLWIPLVLALREALQKNLSSSGSNTVTTTSPPEHVESIKQVFSHFRTEIIKHIKFKASKYILSSSEPESPDAPCWAVQPLPRPVKCRCNSFSPCPLITQAYNFLVQPKQPTRLEFFLKTPYEVNSKLCIETLIAHELQQGLLSLETLDIKSIRVPMYDYYTSKGTRRVHPKFLGNQTEIQEMRLVIVKLPKLREKCLVTHNFWVRKQGELVKAVGGELKVGLEIEEGSGSGGSGDLNAAEGAEKEKPVEVTVESESSGKRKAMHDELSPEKAVKRREIIVLDD